MRRVACCILFLSSLLPAQFEGTFTGKLPQGEMKLILTKGTGPLVRGEIHLFGAVLPLSGQIENGVLRGNVTIGVATGQFEAKRSGRQLALRVVTGDEVENFDLVSVSEAPAPASAAKSPTAPSGSSLLEDRRLGLRFRVPAGWIGRQTDSGFIMGSETQPGMIVVFPHAAATLETLKQGAADGWVDAEDQVNLTAAGQVRQIGSNGVAVELAGTVQTEKARARAIGLVSPFGSGLFIIAGTAEEKYGPQYAKLADQVAASVEFFKPEVPKEASTWTERFSGRCVAYMKSSYSSGPSYGGFSTGSGWSEKRYLYLFEDGRFQANGSFSGSFDSGGGFGSVGSGPQRQSGTWKVIDQAGQSHLVLEHAGSGRESFKLSRQGTQTFLDGRRWFVVSHQECK